MLELLLLVIALLLVLIYFQLRKNITLTNGFFGAVDTSLREYMAYISNLENAKFEARHKEICEHLNDISIYTQRTAKLISEDKSSKSIEEHYEDNKQQWLPK
jgi:hypothetical protein